MVNDVLIGSYISFGKELVGFLNVHKTKGLLLSVNLFGEGAVT